MLLGVLAASLTGCYLTSAYTPPQGLTSDRMALVAAGSMSNLARGALPGAMQLDVYNYAGGCPDIRYRLSGRGYRGSVPLVRGQLREVALNGDEPVLLKGQWTDGSRICSGGLVFRPRSGTTYVYVFVPPGPGDPSCGAVLKEIVDPNATPATTVPVRHVKRIDIRRDVWSGMTTDEDLCALAAVRADEPPVPPAAAAPTPAVAPAPDVVATPASANAAPASATAPPASANALHPPPPPTRPLGTVAATEPSYAPVRNRRISGSSFGLRFGFAGGGDTLASAQASDGSSRSVSGGAGGAVAADLKLTPFWLRDTAGFGAGAEIGWKGQEISADNGSVSLSRFPLVITAHVILRATDYAYFMFSGGVEKDLAVSFTGSGVGALNGDLSFKSSIGGAGAVSFYYAVTPHFTLDAAVRFASLHYDVTGPGGSGRVDASNGGFSTGAQYQF